MLAVMQKPKRADSIDSLVDFRDELFPEPFSAEGHYFDPYSQIGRLKKIDLDELRHSILCELYYNNEITIDEYSHAVNQTIDVRNDYGKPKNANEVAKLVLDLGERTVEYKFRLYCSTKDTEESLRRDSVMINFINRHLSKEGITAPRIIGSNSVDIEGERFAYAVKEHVDGNTLEKEDAEKNIEDFLAAANAVYKFGKAGILGVTDLRKQGIRVKKRSFEVNAGRYFDHFDSCASKDEKGEFIQAYRSFAGILRAEINRNAQLDTGDSRAHNFIVLKDYGGKRNVYMIDVEPDRSPIGGEYMQISTGYHGATMLYLSVAIDAQKAMSREQMESLEEELINEYVSRLREEDKEGEGVDEENARKLWDYAKIDNAIEKIVDNLEKYSTDPGREDTALRALQELQHGIERRISKAEYHGDLEEYATLKALEQNIYRQIMKSDYEKLKDHAREYMDTNSLMSTVDYDIVSDFRPCGHLDLSIFRLAA